MKSRTECLAFGKRLDKSTSFVYPYCARCYSRRKTFKVAEPPPVDMRFNPRAGRDEYSERLRRGFAMMKD